MGVIDEFSGVFIYKIDAILVNNYLVYIIQVFLGLYLNSGLIA